MVIGMIFCQARDVFGHLFFCLDVLKCKGVVIEIQRDLKKLLRDYNKSMFQTMSLGGSNKNITCNGYTKTFT